MSSSVSGDGLLDLQRLNDWLSATHPKLGIARAAEKFSGGQSNPTYRVRFDDADRVLRRKPPGVLLASAHAVEREYRVLSAVASQGVPVPVVHALCENPDVLGSPFYLMDYLDGRIFWDPALTELSADQREAAYTEIARVLARIHRVDIAAAGLGDYGKPGNYYSRQIDRWTRQYRHSELRTIAAMEQLIEALPRRIPADETEPSLVHGDFRIDNLVFAHDRMQIIGVLDWELSTLGDALGDASYFALTWHLPRVGPIQGLFGLPERPAGIPSEQAFAASYAQFSGRALPADWPFYVAYNLFRLAAIAQGVAHRASTGQASSKRAHDVGSLVDGIAERAIQLLG